MSISAVQSSRKRKQTAKIYGLHTFAHRGCPISPSGPFHKNIRLFLRECADPEGYNVEGMAVWCTFLVHENRGFLLPLYTIEENVRHSLRPFCDYCRSTGWSQHLITKRKYHMIIPVDEEWNKPLEEGVFDLQTHLLHGLIHCNGFGHLICINGIEGGSKYVCGKEIMDLWDRICTILHARKITVEDVSKKHLMDLRLLHGVAYGHPWFGRWGYRFCHGSFGVTENKYERAIEILSSLELDIIVQDYRRTCLYRDIKHIIRYYRDTSEIQLVTIRDLIRFMLSFKSRFSKHRKLLILGPAPLPSSKKMLVVKEKSVKCRKFSTVAANLDSRWPVRRLEYAANVIVNALKEKRALSKYSNAGMTRQEARDAARLHIGDTGLIDYVLKSMNNVVVGGQIVRRAVNPSTRVLEYTIQESGKDEVQINDLEPERETEIVRPSPTLIPGSDVYKDMAYLYRNILVEYPGSELVKMAAQVILDSKHFVKNWPFVDGDDELLRYFCRVIPSFRDAESTQFPPGECVVVPLHSTVGDLKTAVEESMRDTYSAMENLVVTEIEGMEEVGDEEVLFGAIESGSEVWVRGVGMEYDASETQYEGGAENWTVRCRCGAKDDDGERMVACDVCEIWQHTRCCGIADAEAVPPLFVCAGCCASLMPSRSQQYCFEYESSEGDSSLLSSLPPPIADLAVESLQY